MRTRWLIGLVSVVALLATACDSAQEEQAADTNGDDEAQVDDGNVQQSLEDAVATSIEQGPAEFTATSQRANDAGSAAGTDADEDGATDEDGVTDADRASQVYTEGVVDFSQGLREMSFVPAGSIQDAEVSMILDQDDLYVQLADAAPSGDDEAPDETNDADPGDARWARVGMDEIVDVDSRASQVLLHDPYPMLQALQNATVDVREGTPIGATDSDGDSVEDEGTTSGEDDSVDDGLAEQPDLIATIELAESDQPALEALSEQRSSDELDIQVWVEAADGAVEPTNDNGEENEVDERVQQLAISVPAAATDEVGGATEDAVAADEDWELMIRLISFGSEIGVEAPQGDAIVETGTDELRAMLNGQRESVEATPTPTPDDDADDGTSTDS